MPLVLDRRQSFDSAREQVSLLASALYEVLHKTGCLDPSIIVDGVGLLEEAQNFVKADGHTCNPVEVIFSNVSTETNHASRS